jgi:aspartyl/asparaginyl beta-hydroxylase (cupin superfamily)
MESIKDYVEQAIAKTADGKKSFFDVDMFPWTKELESRWGLIRAELDSLLTDMPSLPGFEEIQKDQESLTVDRRWKIFLLCAYGHWPAYSSRRCPETMKAIQLIPGLQAAMFSILQPNKEIPEHRGPYSGVLRYHLGLKVPLPHTLCGINVGGDVRHWREGASLIFDDSHMHHAWNRSEEDRVVLFVDFVRPLPPRLMEINERVIAEFSRSTFITETMRQWEQWQRIHWPEM